MGSNRLSPESAPTDIFAHLETLGVSFEDTPAAKAYAGASSIAALQNAAAEYLALHATAIMRALRLERPGWFGRRLLRFGASRRYREYLRLQNEVFCGAAVLDLCAVRLHMTEQEQWTRLQEVVEGSWPIACRLHEARDGMSAGDKARFQEVATAALDAFRADVSRSPDQQLERLLAIEGVERIAVNVAKLMERTVMSPTWIDPRAFREHYDRLAPVILPSSSRAPSLAQPLRPAETLGTPEREQSTSHEGEPAMAASDNTEADQPENYAAFDPGDPPSLENEPFYPIEHEAKAYWERFLPRTVEHLKAQSADKFDRTIRFAYWAMEHADLEIAIRRPDVHLLERQELVRELLFPAPEPGAPRRPQRKQPRKVELVHHPMLHRHASQDPPAPELALVPATWLTENVFDAMTQQEFTAVMIAAVEAKQRGEPVSRVPLPRRLLAQASGNAPASHPGDDNMPADSA